MTEKFFSYRRQSGFSLIEFSIAFSVLGVVASLLFVLWEPQSKMTRQSVFHSKIDRAQDAVYAFAKLKGRLPCPASSNDGLENCSAVDGKGFLPFLSIGFPESSPIGYEVPLMVPSLTGGAYFQVLLASGIFDGNGGPSPQMTLLSDLSGISKNPTTLDLCASLLDPISSATMAFYLAGGAEGVAPNSGNFQQISVSRMELAGRLNCANISASARAHFNTLLASTIIQRGAFDALAQATDDYWVNVWNLSQASFSVSSSSFSVEKSLWLAWNSEARFKLKNNNENGEQVYAQIFAWASFVFAGETALVSASNQPRLAIVLDDLRGYLSEIEDNKNYLTQMDSEIRGRAIRSAGSLYFLESPLGDVR